MPAGLVNQLQRRDDFLDIIRFLIEISEGGTARMHEIKKALNTE